MLTQSRRTFLKRLGAITTGSQFFGCSAAEAEPPPETTRLRLGKIPGVCIAPQYVANALLHAEGFDEVSYIPVASGLAYSGAIANGELGFGINFVSALVASMDARLNITVLSGVHSGCFEVFARPGIDRISELKGKSVGVQALGSSPHLFLSAMANYVGLDPVSEINWIVDPEVKPKQLFLAGRVDAFLGFPPEPQELRASGAEHVIVNSALDRPWSQYFCCMIAANSDFLAKHPIASKRTLRAFLKAADYCSAEPAQSARHLVDEGFTENYAFALEALRELEYRKWREYDPEDTIRFYALRLLESGMIKSDPESIIANNTNWNVLNELRRELKI